MIRIKHEGIYTIEVNEQGDTIEFNVQDPNFFENVLEFYEAVENLDKDYQKAIKDQIKHSDIKVNGVSEREKFMLKSYKQYFANGREAVDVLFGVGSALKIFGKFNSLTMFNQFAEQLNPILKEAGVSLENQLKAYQEEFLKDNEEETL